MTDFSVQQALTNKIIRGLSEKLFCEVHPTRPRKPNGVAQRYNPDYRSDLDPKRVVTGAPTVVSRENGNTSIGDVESAVSHVVDGGSLSAVPDKVLGETIVRDIANGSGRFEVIADRTTPDGVLKFRDTSTGVVYGLKHHDGEDALEDAGRVEILASRVAEEFGFAQGRMRVASDLGENGSFAVLMEMPDSVVAGDTRDLVPVQSLSQADTDDVVRLVLMDFVLSNPSRSPLDIMGSSDDGVSLHPVSHSGHFIGVQRRDRQGLQRFVEDAVEANHPALVELQRRLGSDDREKVVESLRRLSAQLNDEGNIVGLKRFMADTGRLPTSNRDGMRSKHDSVSDRMATLRLVAPEEVLDLLDGAEAPQRSGASVVGVKAPKSAAARSQDFSALKTKEKKTALADIVKSMPHLEQVLGLNLTYKSSGGKGSKRKAGELRNLREDQVEEALESIISHFEGNIDLLLSQTAPGYDSPMLVDGQLTDAAKETQAWYNVANKLAGNIADELGVRPETAAALLAIFSAGTDWRDNVALAVHAARVWKQNDVIDEFAAKKVQDSYLIAKRNGLKYKKGQALVEAEAHVADIESLSPAEFIEGLGGEVGQPLQDQGGGFVSVYLRSKVKDFGGEGGLKKVGITPSESGDGSYSLTMLDGDASTGMHSTYKFRSAEEKFFEKFGKAYNPNKASAAEKEFFEEASQGTSTYEKAFRLLDADKASKDMTTQEYVTTHISGELGTDAKVRSFYNNIVDPADTRFQSLTADTHHFNAVSLIPAGGSFRITKENNPAPWKDRIIPKKGIESISSMFATKATTGGFSGGYWLAREAALRKAAEYGILPREMQSILWEQQRRLWINSDLKDGVAEDIYKTLRKMGVIDEEQFRALYLQKYAEAVGATLPTEQYTEIEDRAGLLTGLM
jgi:hypothetical protein